MTNKMNTESIERAIKARADLIREKAATEAKLKKARADWARAAAEGNSPREEAINTLIGEAREAIEEADYKIRALEDLEISPGQSLLSLIEQHEAEAVKASEAKAAAKAMAAREAEAARQRRISEKERELLNSEAKLVYSNGRIVNGTLTVNGVTFHRNDHKGFFVPEWKTAGGQLLHDYLDTILPLTEEDWLNGGFSPDGERY